MGVDYSAVAGVGWEYDEDAFDVWKHNQEEVSEEALEYGMFDYFYNAELPEHWEVERSGSGSYGGEDRICFTLDADATLKCLRGELEFSALEKEMQDYLSRFGLDPGSAHFVCDILIW